MKKEAMLYDKLGGARVKCRLCGHGCSVADGKYGFCGVRKNENGVLYTLVYGNAVASGVDPIEKKPLYHFLPGSTTYSIATVGCNFRCGFCQNWQISQVIHNNRGGLSLPYCGYELKPEEVVREAKKHKCKSVSYTYTEPTVFFEYAYDTAALAKEENIRNTFVTNGYMTPDALDTIKPYLDAANVDLKFFREETYKSVCSGSLKPVLDSIRHMKENEVWVEVTTLVVPGMNDSEKELRDIASFIADTGEEIPWHISRFHPNYKVTDTPATPMETIKKAEAIGKEAGLKYVYLGNVAEDTNTFCPKCNELLIERAGYSTTIRGLESGKCSKCGSEIDGVWG